MLSTLISDKVNRMGRNPYRSDNNNRSNKTTSSSSTTTSETKAIDQTTYISKQFRFEHSNCQNARQPDAIRNMSIRCVSWCAHLTWEELWDEYSSDLYRYIVLCVCFFSINKYYLIVLNAQHSTKSSKFCWFCHTTTRNIIGCGLLLLLWYSSHLAEKLSKYLKCGIMWIDDRVWVFVCVCASLPKQRKKNTNTTFFILPSICLLQCLYIIVFHLVFIQPPDPDTEEHTIAQQPEIFGSFILNGYISKRRERERDRERERRHREKEMKNKICCWKWISNKYSAIVLHSEPFVKPQKMLLFNIFNWVERPTDQTKCKPFKF